MARPDLSLPLVGWAPPPCEGAADRGLVCVCTRVCVPERVNSGDGREHAGRQVLQLL